MMAAMIPPSNTKQSPKPKITMMILIMDRFPPLAIKDTAPHPLQDEGPPVVPPAFAPPPLAPPPSLNFAMGEGGGGAFVALDNGSRRPLSSRGNFQEWKSFGEPAASHPPAAL